MDRAADLIRFYDLLDRLETRIGGKRCLADCSGRMAWPRRGLYFFFEHGEQRSDSGDGPRVVRVGTHALAARSGTSLWSRLSQHRGVVSSGGGSHRGSIFRLIVGTALSDGDVVPPPSWGQGNTADRSTREAEMHHEQQVSSVIRTMPFLWLEIDDEPGPDSVRGLVERNSIALLSNFRRAPLDPPSPGWLGHRCNRERVRLSGLWNQNHVEETHASGFLDTLERLIS